MTPLLMPCFAPVGTCAHTSSVPERPPESTPPCAAEGAAPSSGAGGGFASCDVAPARAGGRLLSIDAMRGLVMLLMTLDHVRGHFTYAAYALWGDATPLPPDPLNLHATTPLFFCMRWVTHLCAPSFIFLAGVSIHLWRQRHAMGHHLSARLATRGLMLVGLNMALGVRDPLSADRVVVLDVLWPIGISMLLLAFAVHLPRTVAWVVALLLVAGHDALHGVMLTGDVASIVWQLALVRSYIDVPGVGGLYILYPVLPWFGVMWLGYLCGGLFAADNRARGRALPRLGLAFLAAFVLLRLGAGYGDPVPFVVQDIAWRTAAAFVGVSKYPPSLQFVLVTLGGMWLLLAWFDNRCPRPGGQAFGCPGWLRLPGGTPLFYYVAHLAVIRALTPLLATTPSPMPELAFSAAGIAFVAAGVFVVLLPACAWVARRRGVVRPTRKRGEA